MHCDRRVVLHTLPLGKMKLGILTADIKPTNNNASLKHQHLENYCFWPTIIFRPHSEIAMCTEQYPWHKAFRDLGTVIPLLKSISYNKPRWYCKTGLTLLFHQMAGKISFNRSGRNYVKPRSHSAIFNAIFDAIWRTKRALPYPARVFRRVTLSQNPAKKHKLDRGVSSTNMWSFSFQSTSDAGSRKSIRNNGLDGPLILRHVISPEAYSHLW